MSKPTQPRDHRTGQYAFAGNMDRICVCGHSLGDHSIGAPHDCLVPTFSASDERRAECDCPKFRLSRKQR